MATIIKTKRDPEKYVLLGCGYGMYQAKKPHWFLGNLSAETSRGNVQVLCVCNEEGQLVWLRSDNIDIVSIDGKAPAEYFQ